MLPQNHNRRGQPGGGVFVVPKKQKGVSSSKAGLVWAFLVGFCAGSLVLFFVLGGFRSDGLRREKDAMRANGARVEDSTVALADREVSVCEAELGRLHTRLMELENSINEMDRNRGIPGRKHNAKRSKVNGEDNDKLAEVEEDDLPGTSQVLVFVGIQTGFETDPDDESGNYAKRRQVIRETWMPSKKYQKHYRKAGIVTKFVIGHSKDLSREQELQKEVEKYDDFMRIPTTESYANLAVKSRVFLEMVMLEYSPDYIIKVDDDVYVRLDRIPGAIRQWKEMNADYVGCMKHGDVLINPKYKWYEPQHGLLGKEYFAHSWGSLYILSSKAVTAILAIDEKHLRNFANEDVTIGSWMLALNMNHYDDRRLCMSSCAFSGLAMIDIPHPGLMPVVERMRELDESDECRKDRHDFNQALQMQRSAISFSD
jgi:hypothetical protein